MQILITGGTGFIGSHLIEALLPAHHVSVLVRDTKKLDRFAYKDQVEWISGDVLNLQPIPDRFDYVIHLASITKVVSPTEYKRNQQGMLSLLANLSGCSRLRKIVLLSSIAAAGPSSCSGGSSEDMTAAPISRYGKSKLEEEHVLQTHAPKPYLILRAPIVFGERDLDMLELFKIINIGIMPRLGRHTRQFSIIYVGDLVDGIMRATFSDIVNDMFYLSHPDVIEWESFMRSAAQIMGKKRLLTLTIPETIGKAVGVVGSIVNYLGGKGKIINRDKIAELLQPCWLCSTEKSKRLLQFTTQSSIKAKLEQTIAWYKQNKLL